MISGLHALIFSPEADALRAFLRDKLQLPWVDAHDGWLIFGMPPAELGVHPSEGETRHQLFLMCEDVRATVEALTARGVEFTTPIGDQGFGLMTTMRVPGGELSLYQPTHPTALGLEP